MLEKPQKLFDYSILPRNKGLIKFSRELRKQGILSEVLLWKAIKDRNYTSNYDIDRQIIIGNYIVDFFVSELGFIIEIDGSTHDNKYEQDLARDEILRSYGLEVLRISHIDCLQNLDSVIHLIQNQIKERIKYLKSN
jgi:very-short-patch-repair endonuclease